MSDYTPNTNGVLGAYIIAATEGDLVGGAREFDRWLASERAAIWDEVVATIRRCDPKCTVDCDVCVFRGDVLADITPNPYREGGL